MLHSIQAHWMRSGVFSTSLATPGLAPCKSLYLVTRALSSARSREQDAVAWEAWAVLEKYQRCWTIGLVWKLQRKIQTAFENVVHWPQLEKEKNLEVKRTHHACRTWSLRC